MFYLPACPIKVPQKKLTVFSEKLGIMNYSKVYLFIRLFDFICLHLMDISRYDNTYFPSNFMFNLLLFQTTYSEPILYIEMWEKYELC